MDANFKKLFLCCIKDHWCPNDGYYSGSNCTITAKSSQFPILRKVCKFKLLSFNTRKNMLRNLLAN